MTWVMDRGSSFSVGGSVSVEGTWGMEEGKGNKCPITVENNAKIPRLKIHPWVLISSQI